MDPNVDKYGELKERIEKSFDGWVAENSQRAHDYGVLTLKSLFLVSGGGLLAIPALSGLSDSFQSDIGVFAAGFFGGTVFLCILCAYFAYWNWTCLHIMSIETRDHHLSLAWQSVGGAKADEANWSSRNQALRRQVMLSFWCAHASGVFGLLAFAAGASALFSSFDLSAP